MLSLILVVIIIFLIVCIVPLIQYKILKSEDKETIQYIFSQDLLDTEFKEPILNYFNKEEFEKRKIEEYKNELS